MTSRKLFSFSIWLFVAAALIYGAAIALGGTDRVGHYDLIEMINGTHKTTLQAGALSGDTTFTLPATAGTSSQVFHGGATPAYGAVSLTAEVSGTLPVANGGTGQTSTSGAFNAISPMTTLGDIIYGASSGSGTRLGGNTTSTKNFLTQTGDGVNSAVPAWGTIAVGDVPSLPASKITSGTLAVAQGGTNLASGTSGGVLAYTASGTLASSGALTANAVVIGGGAGVVPSVVTNNSTGTNEFLTQSSSGAPAWAALLAADIPSLPASKITSGQIAITNGGTGAATKAAGFDALSPMSAAGDVIYGGVSGTGTRLAAGSSTQLFHGGTTPSWAAASLTADVSGTLPVANGGTGITSFGTGVATWLGTPSSANLAAATTDETGSGALVFGTAPTITLANGTGLPISTGVSGLGSGVATFLATPSSANLATAVTDETGSGALVFGTAPTITLANGTGLPISTGVSGLGSNVAAFLATPSSANLASAVTDETGSGALCFATSPQFSTNVDLLAAGESRYYNAGGTFYVGFKGGNAAANKIWTLPLVDGSAGQVLKTDGSAVLGWVSAATNPMTTTGDIIYSSDNSGTPARRAVGTSTQVIHGGTTPSYSAVSLTADVSGVLPMANGGTNKNSTAVNGGLVWSDADSFEITAAGTSQNWVLSGGAGAPTMSNTTTTGKFVDGSADEIQMRVQGNGTQTSNILTVEKSDSTLLMNVTNVNGTAIKGTTSNDAASAGYVGETIRTDKLRSAATSLSSGVTTNIVSVTLTAGDWNLTGVLGALVTGTTSVTAVLYAISTTSATLPSGNDSFAVPNASGEVRMQWASSASVPANDTTYQITSYAINIASTTTFYMVVNPTFSISTMSGYGMLQARRVR